MTEKKKTIIFAGVALALVLITIVSSPRRGTPDVFIDQGELFYPEFQDPNTALTLEVIEYDSETGAAKPFKVTFSGGRWTIPSHHNYEADAKDRLAKTAAGVMLIRKDDFRSNNPVNHPVCSVVDPLDETGPLEGRGTRVTIRGENDAVLSDLIIGGDVEGKQGFKFVRVPEQKAVYAAKIDVDISTNFSDWIDTDLLQVEKEKIERILLNDYSINEQTLKVEQREKMTLTKSSDDWNINNLRSDEEIVNTVLDGLISGIDDLTIVGVRPKPAGLTSSLTAEGGEVSMNRSDLLSLQDKGYYMTRDGSLRSNEGELKFNTTEGIEYILRFGEVAYGTGLALTAGTEDAGSADAAGENRYLFVSAGFNENYFTEPRKPSDLSFQTKPDSTWTDADRANKELQDAYEEWERNVENGRKVAKALNDRFAKWYYVISGLIFDQFDLDRSDLIKKKDTGN